MLIRNATLTDLKKILEIEKQIEKEYPADYDTLFARLNTFSDGFFVVEEDKGICGYVESCLWNKERFQTFEQISDFPKNHDPNGKILYVIYLGVLECCRRKGYGSHLIKSLIAYAKEHNLSKVQLVAGEGFLVNFYKGLGFSVVENLPDFLPDVRGVLMEYVLE